MGLQLIFDYPSSAAQVLLDAASFMLHEEQEQYNLLLQLRPDHQFLQPAKNQGTVTYFEAQVDRDPDDPDKYLHLALAYYQLQDWGKAAWAATEAIDRYVSETDASQASRSALAYTMRGYAYAASPYQSLDERKPALNVLKALADFEAATNLKADYAVPHYYLGALHCKLKHWDKAEKWFKKAIELKPDYAEVYNDLGVLYLSLKAYEQALAPLEHAVQIDQENYIYLGNLASIYMALERWQDAEFALRKAITWGPEDAYQYNELGLSYFKQNAFDEAEESFQHAIRLKPDCTAAYENLGDLYYRMNRFAEAENAFIQVLNITPESVDARNSLHFLRIERLKTAITIRFKAISSETGIDVEALADCVTEDVLAALNADRASSYEVLTQDDLVAALSPAVEHLGAEERYRFASMLYRRALLPSDKAAQVAGLEDAEFLTGLEPSGIPALNPEDEHPLLPVAVNSCPPLRVDETPGAGKLASYQEKNEGVAGIKESQFRSTQEMMPENTDKASETDDIHRLHIAEAAAQQASDNMMILTHQLQAPLYSAVGALSLMKLQNKDAALKQRLTYVEALLEDAINLCFGMSASFFLEQGHTTALIPETLNAPVELKALVDRLQATNARQDLSFTLRVESGFSSLRMDKNVFVSVFYSLIHNAMKYAERGSEIILECGFERASGDAILKVTSVGEPIAPAEAEQIFRKFVRGQGTQTGRHHSGTGLGLWVARSLMRSIGGELSVELSAQNSRLATFIVRIPKLEAPGVHC